MLFLVRHGRPLVEPGVPASRWTLDPAAYDDVVALRDRLPVGATWCTSPEPKALETAQLLHDGELAVVPALVEQLRGEVWVEDFEGAVRRAFDRPDEPAVDGWEPLAVTEARVTAAARSLLASTTGDLVLVGHGTAWTVLRAALTGGEPDLDAWAALRLPDLWVV